MASFTGVGDNVELSVADVGEDITIALSGTYNMTIVFQRELGSPGSGAWETLKTYTTANATVSEVYRTVHYNGKYRLYVTVDNSGTCTATLTDSAKEVYRVKDGVGNTIMSATQSGITFPGTVTVDGAATVTGAATFSSTASFTGAVTMAAEPVTTSGVGAKNGATVTAVEKGDGVIHQTTLTLTATPVTITDDAGVAQYGGVGKIYDFPAGAICILGAVVDGDLTLGTTGTIINTYDGAFSLGTATATTGATLVGTEADILQSCALTQAVSKVAALDTGFPVATALTESGARWFNGTDTAIDMYLNFVIADDASHTSGTGTFTGTVKFLWANLGTIAA